MNELKNRWMKIKMGIKELWRVEKYHWCGAVVLGVVLTFGVSVHWTQGYSEKIQDGIASKVVRFHVLANSDTPEDQELKLEVRDKVLESYGELLSQCENKEETLEALEEVQVEICKIATAEVVAQGYEYPVSVSIAREEFPFKQYGELIFPAGIYDALRIEIGEAKGENWWCVLYPQMCYVDASWGYTTDESYHRLENTLTEEEFLIISAMEQEKVVPKIKFKVVEWWQER